MSIDLPEVKKCLHSSDIGTLLYQAVKDPDHHIDQRGTTILLQHKNKLQ